MNRQVKYLIIHCTATQKQASIQSIKDYWKDVKKWNSVGYHILIEADGDYTQIAPYEAIVNGALGYNYNSIHIAYIGGIDSTGKATDTRTDAQKQTLRSLVEYFKGCIEGITVLGHRDLPNVLKSCPCFDVQTQL